jgi:hypothetical protein
VEQEGIHYKWRTTTFSQRILVSVLRCRMEVLRRTLSRRFILRCSSGHRRWTLVSVSDRLRRTEQRAPQEFLSQSQRTEY